MLCTQQVTAWWCVVTAGVLHHSTRGYTLVLHGEATPVLHVSGLSILCRLNTLIDTWATPCVGILLMLTSCMWSSVWCSTNYKTQHHIDTIAMYSSIQRCGGYYYSWHGYWHLLIHLHSLTHSTHGATHTTTPNATSYPYALTMVVPVMCTYVSWCPWYVYPCGSLCSCSC